ncbi:MAG: hypothetical protein P8X42_18200, partial [Calditrichaceae bacterium]
MKMKILLCILSLILIQCDFNYNNPVDTNVSLSGPKMLQSIQEDEWIRLNWEPDENYLSGYLIMRRETEEPWT